MPLWVAASFKETQITDRRPGQPVTLSIDAYPNFEFQGHVDSIQSGLGTGHRCLFIAAGRTNSLLDTYTRKEH
jgi:membrane fusion protein (multidrug efflux system)